MSRDARVKCVGCNVTNEQRLSWWFRDALTGVGVCSACSCRRDAEKLRAQAVAESAKRRAMVSA